MEKYCTAGQADDSMAMRIPCWVIFKICNAYYFSAGKMVSRTRLNVTYTYTACLKSLELVGMEYVSITWQHIRTE
jgi:hypothetical protein